MPLSAGTRLGQYEILSELGVGGMGEVYRARDRKLNRDVAIKVLPDAFAADPDRLARFEREAQVLASLNHPHIGAIYGVEDATGRPALVLELVDGATLSDRIARGPIPIQEVVAIAKQLANALSAAHDKSIVHRDLKPANIKLTPDGTVKVLDFGLATAVARSQPGGSGEHDSTTMALISRAGVVVGTAAYMSPEQARGLSVDKRTDIWAFGCVFYEMLAGRRAFEGATSSDVMVSVLEREPDWSLLPAATPPVLVRLLRRCLEKDARRRVHDIMDASLDLDESLASAIPDDAGRATARPSSAVRTTVIMLAVAVIAASVTWLVRPTLPIARQLAAVRLSFAPDRPLADASDACPTSQCAGDLVVAISPDGSRLVYAAGSAAEHMLYDRPLDRFEGRPIPGTEGALSPAFSPDGRHVAFVADRKLKRIALDGGTPIVLWQLPSAGDGVSWSDDGTILVGSGVATGIWRVPENGGKAEQVTVLGGSETLHRTPEALPGGKALLFSAVDGITSEEIFVQSLETGARTRLPRGINPHFISGDRLVWLQDDTLFMAGFDPVRLELIGAPVPVVQGIRHGFMGGGQLAVSKSGSIAFVPATDDPHVRSLVWVSRSGVETPTDVANQGYIEPRLSPDGKRIGVVIGDGTEDVWTYEIERHTWSRITTDERSLFPLWSPDGHRLAFASARTGAHNIYVRPSDGSGQDTRLIASDRINFPISWSASGILAFVRIDATTKTDIWTTPVDPAPNPTLLLQTPFREGAPTFSADSKWMAYVADESGRPEVYVRAFPGHGERWTISTGGGNEPVWSRDGTQLFYRSGESIMAVAVKTSPTFSAGVPQRLFDGPYERSTNFWCDYDVSPDGSRFLMVKRVNRTPLPRQINVIVNGLADLKR